MDEAFAPASSVTGRPLARSARPDLHWSLGGDGGRSARRQTKPAPRRPQEGVRLLARTQGVAQHPYSMAGDPEYRAELARVMRYLLIESHSAQARHAAAAMQPIPAPPTRGAKARLWMAAQVSRPLVGLPIVAGLLATAGALIFL